MTLAELGHNQPPSDEDLLREKLAVETSTLWARAEALTASAGRVVIDDEESAGRAAVLAKMINEHQKLVSGAREARKAPFLAQGRIVDGAFNAILTPLQAAKGHVLGHIDAFRKLEQARQIALRRQQEEAAQKALAEAEAAAAAAQQSGKVDDEIAAAQAWAKVDHTTKQAEAIDTSARIDTGYGVSAGARKRWVGEIVDIKAALRHAAKIDPKAMQDAVQGVLDRQVRAGIREFPGAEIKQVETTVVR